jgi:hypothetical protein
MAGAGHAVRRGVLERGPVRAGRMSPLGAGEIERHDPRAPVVRRGPGELEGLGG